jgi:hypothetical protein
MWTGPEPSLARRGQETRIARSADHNPNETHKSCDNADHQTRTSVSRALDGVAAAGKKSEKSVAEIAAGEAAAAAQSQRIQDRLQGL